MPCYFLLKYISVMHFCIFKVNTSCETVWAYKQIIHNLWLLIKALCVCAVEIDVRRCPYWCEL